MNTGIAAISSISVFTHLRHLNTITSNSAMEAKWRTTSNESRWWRVTSALLTSVLLLTTTHTSIHAMYCCCTLHTYQYMLCIVAVHYTHINTHYVLLLYTTHTSIHAMYCCCTLHIHQYLLCIVAVHYTHINTRYVLLLYTTHTSIHAMYCCCTLHTHQYMLCIVAIVDCTHIGSATDPPEDLQTLKENTMWSYSKKDPKISHCRVHGRKMTRRNIAVGHKNNYMERK